MAVVEQMMLEIDGDASDDDVAAAVQAARTQVDDLWAAVGDDWSWDDDDLLVV